MSNKNYIFLIFGKKGSGKSYMAEWFLKSFNRVIVYDTMRQFNDDFMVITSFVEFTKILKLITKNKITTFRISLQFKDYLKNFAPTNYLLVNNLRNFTYVVDEIHNYVSAVRHEENFEAMIVEGRHFQLNLITISHRPYNLPAVLILNADYLAIFETGLKRDKEFFMAYKYLNIEDIDRLKDYEFLFVNLKKKYSAIQKIT